MRNYRSILVLVAVLLAAALPTLAGNSGFTWILNSDKTVGMLYAVNVGDLDQSTIRLALDEPAVISGGYTVLSDGTYQYVLLPTPLAPGGIVALTLTGAGGDVLNFRRAELGEYYTWLNLPAGTQATVKPLVGGSVVVKSADGTLNALYVMGPDQPAQVLRVQGSDVSVGSGYATFAAGGYTYVNLGAPTVAGAVTVLPIVAGEVKGVEFGSWAVWSEAGSVLTIVNVGEPKNAAVVNVRSTAGVVPSLVVADSYVVQASGAHVGIALSPSETARQWDFGTNGVGDLIRIWLPVSVNFGESVVLKFDAAPRVFTASLGTQMAEPVVVK